MVEGLSSVLNQRLAHLPLYHSLAYLLISVSDLTRSIYGAYDLKVLEPTSQTISLPGVNTKVWSLAKTASGGARRRISDDGSRAPCVEQYRVGAGAARLGLCQCLCLSGSPAMLLLPQPFDSPEDVPKARG